MNDCSQTKTFLLLAADGELGADQSDWLEQHIFACPACAAEQQRFHQLDQNLGAYGEMLVRDDPRHMPAQRKIRAVMQWAPAFAATLAAVLLLTVILVHRMGPANADEAAFVPIPYVQPLDRYETATVVRMDVSVQALIAAGYKIDVSDPTAPIQADVLVGEDGRAHAVRILSNAILN